MRVRLSEEYLLELVLLRKLIQRGSGKNTSKV
jgi:hypothetical protein